jgi:GT2 family glycosyltransferase
MTESLTSIIIINYNGQEHIDECLYAIYHNTNLPVEVIVVDNASIDGSINLLKSNNPGVKLITNETNKGYAQGINQGLCKASGAYFVVLNMDVIVEQNWLAPLISFLESHPEAGAATPCIMLYGQQHRINALGQNVHVTGLGFNRKLNYPVDTIDREPVRVSGLHGSAFIVRTEQFRQLGGMNENYFLYHEDVEISLRLALAGYSIYAVPESIVRHKYLLHMTPQKLQWLERHRWVSILSTYRITTIFVLLPFLLFTEFLMVVYCLIRGLSFFKAKLRAIGWVLSHLSVIKGSRRKMQSVRRLADKQLLSILCWSYHWDQFSVLARQRGGWLYEAMSSLLTRRSHDRAA